ncbi:MAG: DUF6688 family protein [Saprospiraceae bacterium]
MIIFYLFVAITAIYVPLRFLYFLFVNRHDHRVATVLAFVEVWIVLISPIFFLGNTDVGHKNDCCGLSAVFSPDHSLGIYLLIGLCQTAYVVAMFRTKLFPPVPELLLNLLLLLGLAINVLLCFHLSPNSHETGAALWIFGNIPIILLILMRLMKHQAMMESQIFDEEPSRSSALSKLAMYILNLKPVLKFPLLAVLLVPLTVLISLFLMLFGQKPDSLIRAFTETYKHGLSALDYQCNNVDCGGHFLCSVGANGHRTIVRPIRYGVRNGKRILCNRQLLISNAFEELLQEKLPATHAFVRKNYNRVGLVVHRHYGVFKVQFVSDAVYLLMKPLEWFFLFVLYTFDDKPENRIAMQYVDKGTEKQ